MATSPENTEDADSVVADTGEQAAPPEPQPAVAIDPSAEPPYTHTRASGVWAAVVVSLVVLVVLIVFILENPRDVRVDFFGAHGSIALGVALLLSAVIGGLLVVMAGTARILQLRYRARRQHRAYRAGRTPAAPSQ